MLKETLIDKDGYTKVRITLAAGECEATAGSTKKAWHGPGSFIRETWPDGGRQDTGEVVGSARLGFLPTGFSGAAVLLIACAAFGALTGCSGGIRPSYDGGPPSDSATGSQDATADGADPADGGALDGASAPDGPDGAAGDDAGPDDGTSLDGGAVSIAFAPTDANLNQPCGPLGCPSHATVRIYIAGDVVTWASTEARAPSGPPWTFAWSGESYRTAAHLTDTVRIDLYDASVDVTRLTCMTTVVNALADGAITCGRTGDPAFDSVTVEVSP